MIAGLNMTSQSREPKLRAIVLVNDSSQASDTVSALSGRGLSVEIATDPESVLVECRATPADLVVVEDRLGPMSGPQFLSELLKISWTTSAILMCDEEEQSVHERTEGLGILGSIRNAKDVDGLHRLIDKFFGVLSPDQSEHQAEQPARSSDEIAFRPIGIIHSPFKDREGMPIQPDGATGTEGTITLDLDLAAGLKDLDGFSHIILVYCFHLSKGYALEVTPFLDNIPRGVFATRAPRRPNPIGLSVVRLARIAGNTLHIKDVDIVDGTPLLDIKPFVPHFDNRDATGIGWLTGKEGESGQKRADKRFSSD